MGKHFGNLQKVSGIIYYVVSPHEVKPLSGVFNPGLKNTLRRCRESLLWFLIPATVVYVTIDQGNKEYEKSIRKNPEDYVNDV